MPRKWDIIYSSKRLPWTIIQSVFVRFLFFLHNMLAVSRAALVTDEPRFWLQGIAFVFVIIELVYIVGRRRGVEHKWISTSLLLFICIDLMPLWVLELDRAERNDSKDDIVFGVKNETFIFFLEQSFLLLMIIGRWLLPKGRMSRDKLSNLLLILLGKACDMTDFFSLFAEDSVRRNRPFMFSVLSMWTISVFQFPIAHTETKSKEMFIEVVYKSKIKVIIIKGINKCFMTEAWSILVSVFMQELPYLICRSYAIGACGIINNSIIFFLFKNSIVLTMYAYRLVSLYVESQSSNGEPEHKIQTTCSTRLSIVSLDYLDEVHGIATPHIESSPEPCPRSIPPVSHFSRDNILASQRQRIKNLKFKEDDSSSNGSSVPHSASRMNKVYPHNSTRGRMTIRRRSSL